LEVIPIFHLELRLYFPITAESYKLEVSEYCVWQMCEVRRVEDLLTDDADSRRKFEISQ
jgi:hypothetical protein